MSAWISVKERLPNPDEAGGFGAVEVIIQCNPQGGGEPWQGMRIAKPIFLGGNPDRVLWSNMEGKADLSPIENGSWWVTHWRPFPKFPKPEAPQ